MTRDRREMEGTESFGKQLAKRVSGSVGSQGFRNPLCRMMRASGKPSVKAALPLCAPSSPSFETCPPGHRMSQPTCKRYRLFRPPSDPVLGSA